MPGPPVNLRHDARDGNGCVDGSHSSVHGRGVLLRVQLYEGHVKGIPTHTPDEREDHVVDMDGADVQVRPAPGNSALDDRGHHADEETHRNDKVRARWRVEVLGERPCHSVGVERLNSLTGPDVGASRTQEDLALGGYNGHHDHVVDDHAWRIISGRYTNGKLIRTDDSSPHLDQEPR